jgi:hypothetical protein
MLANLLRMSPWGQEGRYWVLAADRPVCPPKADAPLRCREPPFGAVSGRHNLFANGDRVAKTLSCATYKNWLY